MTHRTLLRSRCWFITLNNPVDGDFGKLLASGDYAIVCRERAPTTDTEHLHAVLHYKSKVDARVVQSIIPRMAKEPARSITKAIKYVKKSGDWEERGDYPEPGKRTDLLDYRDDVCAGASEEALMRDHFATWARYPHLSTRIRSVQNQAEQIRRIRERHPLPPVTYIWGDTSVGKTRYVYERHDPADVYHAKFKHDGHLWMDGYVNQKILLIDEFHGQCHVNDMLDLLRPYKLRIDVKGDHVWPVYDMVYITSNTPPDEVWAPRLNWQGVPVERVPLRARHAFLARITHTIHMEAKRPLTTDPPIICYDHLERSFWPNEGDTLRPSQ